VKESHLLLNKMERFCRRPFSGDKARLVFSSLSPSSSRGDDRRHVNGLQLQTLPAAAAFICGKPALRK
jgi:hypothetical protein